jgi:hypothetical protein
VSKPCLVIDRNSALQLSSKLGLVDRRFWRWTSLPDQVVSEYGIIRNDDGLWFGYVPVGDTEFVTLALVSPEDLRAALLTVQNKLVVDAEWLLSFLMSKENARSFVGDLEERSQRIAQTEGRIGAMFYFWWSLIRSLPPVLLQAFRRHTKRTPVSASKVSTRKFDPIVVSTRKLDTIVTTHTDDDHKPTHHRFYI